MDKELLDILDVGTMFLLMIFGGLLFLSGFRFLNPLDAAARIIIGGVCVVGSGLYLWRQWQQWKKIPDPPKP